MSSISVNSNNRLTIYETACYTHLTKKEGVLSTKSSSSALGAWLTGVSKAGFGGGIGMIVVPMFTHFRSARNVIGLMLPLLFSTDIFSLFHYWKQWHRQSVTRLILGSLLGITVASPDFERHL